MSTFELYWELGLNHIADFKGYDHILFILTLCAVYRFVHWKKVLILITAFTLGHTTTLLLASLKLVAVKANWIEFLIPLTIFATATGNILQRKEDFSKKHHTIKYGFALFFGLIHGMGFSNYLRALLGDSESLIGPLFSFNLGIEVGQILIVSVILSLSALFTGFLKLPHREWNLIISGAGLGISLILMIERFPY